MLLLILDEKSDSAEKNTDPGKDLTDEEKDLTDEQEKNFIAHVKEIDLDADREKKIGATPIFLLQALDLRN